MRWLLPITISLLVMGAFWGLLVAPPDFRQGNSYRIIYIHVPAAVVALAGYYVMALAGAVSLIWRIKMADITMRAAAPVGAVLTAIALVTGAIWGKPTWGAWWVWDARITSMLILFFLYLGVVALFEAYENKTAAARACAVLSLVGTVNIPIIYKSVDWWQNRTLHQQSTLRDRSIEDLTLFAMIFGMVVFVAIFAWLMIHRFRIGWLEHQTETVGLEAAIEERRAQTSAAIFDAVTDSRPSHETGSD